MFRLLIVHAVSICFLFQVAGIVGRAELWSAVFYFFAFLLYQLVVSGPDTDFFTSIVCSLLTVILGGMGMLFKEQGITVLVRIKTLFHNENGF